MHKLIVVFSAKNRHEATFLKVGAKHIRNLYKNFDGKTFLKNDIDIIERFFFYQQYIHL